MSSALPLAAVPAFARPMHERLARLGTVLATSSTDREGESVAWAIVLETPAATFAIAVARREPANVVALRSALPPDDAMAMMRSLVVRSAKKLAQGGLCAATFDDLEEVPFAIRAPQFLVAPATSFGVALPDVSLAVACTWDELAGDPEAREAAVRARSPHGTSGEVLVPGARAVAGMVRSLRKAKEPLLRGAAWAFQSLIEDHVDLVRAPLETLALAKNLDGDRAELVGALVDTYDAVVVSRLPEATPSRPRAVLALVRFPEAAGGKNVPAYFFDASDNSRSTLGARLPESPVDGNVAAAGFACLDALFAKHQRTVQVALAVQGALRLQRGFHLDASMDQLARAFAADGFTVVPLVLDSADEPS